MLKVQKKKKEKKKKKKLKPDNQKRLLGFFVAIDLNNHPLLGNEQRENNVSLHNGQCMDTTL